MNRSLSHSLLIDNEFYLQAVQHRRVTVENLGFQELHCNYGNTRNKTGKRVLKAVIPENDQLVFLQKVGLVDSAAFPIAENIPETKPVKVKIRKKRDHSTEHGHKPHSKDKHNKNKQTTSTESAADPLNAAHPPVVRRTSPGGTPLYTKPSQAFLHILESEKEDAIFRTKLKERFTKLGSSFDIVDKEGVKYVYDQRGFKVTEEVYNKYLEEVERDKRRRTAERIVPPHKTEIIEKTRRFVEDLRKRIESETILDFKWYPGKFPATTIVPRPQSADGRYANSMRDISTLGKSLHSAFRKGEPHCLPINLVRRWPEYRVMEEGDVVLTVEHCCNCHEHDMCTHHNEEHYSQLAETVKENLAATAMKFAVRFYSVCKPVEFEDPLAKSLSHSERIVSGQSSHAHNKDKTAFNIDYTQRVGAFEVQVAVRTKKDFICHLLFSKLFKGAWPRIPTMQVLLERVLTEAKFVRLVNDAPATPSRSLSRPGSPKRVPFYVPKEEVAQQLQPEFDKRLPPVDDTPEPSSEPTPQFSPEISVTLDPVPDNASKQKQKPHQDHHLAPLQIGEYAWGESPMVSPPPTFGSQSQPQSQSQSQYTPEQQAAASALARFMKGKANTNPNTTSNSTGDNSLRNSFGADYDSSQASSTKKINSTKAVLLAVGSVAAGLQFVRNKSKNAAEAEKSGMLTHEEAMAIANSSPVKPSKAHMVKKPTIGVLSRQNAGDGQQGRYLMIDDNDEDISLGPSTGGGPNSLGGRGDAKAFFPYPMTKTNSQTSIPFSSNQPSPRDTSPVSPRRASPNKKSSFAAVTEEDETLGFSPMNSSKTRSNSIKLHTVAQVVDISNHGLAFVRHRAASVTNMPQSPTMVEKLHQRQSTGKITQSERIQGRPSSLRQHAHPSLEMRSKLNIGMLSRQNAGIRGDSLVLVDSDSDDDRPGDKPESQPPQVILSAMANAVKAVNQAEPIVPEKEKPARRAPEDDKPAPLLQKKVQPTPAVSGTDVRKSSNATTLDTGDTTERRDAFPLSSLDKPRPHGLADINTSLSTTMATPISALTQNSGEGYDSSTNTPTTTNSQNLVAAATVLHSAAGLPVTAEAAGMILAATTSDSAESPLFQHSSFSQRNTIADRRMSSVEILQQKRGLADQLVLKVSNDILDPIPGEYADDFDDLESPSPGRKGGNGFDDLFENSDYKLDDE